MDAEAANDAAVPGSRHRNPNASVQRSPCVRTGIASAAHLHGMRVCGGLPRGRILLLHRGPCGYLGVPGWCQTPTDTHAVQMWQQQMMQQSQVPDTATQMHQFRDASGPMRVLGSSRLVLVQRLVGSCRLGVPVGRLRHSGSMASPMPTSDGYALSPTASYDPSAQSYMACMSGSQMRVLGSSRLVLVQRLVGSCRLGVPVGRLRQSTCRSMASGQQQNPTPGQTPTDTHAVQMWQQQMMQQSQVPDTARLGLAARVTMGRAVAGGARDGC
jgi:hypothetical protein